METEIIIKKLQTKADKSYQEMLIAKARIYDMIYKNSSEKLLSEIELKSKIITLENNIKEVVKQRDEIKDRIRKVYIENDNLKKEMINRLKEEK